MGLAADEYNHSPPSLRGTICPPQLNERRRRRRNNLFLLLGGEMDCFAERAMTSFAEACRRARVRATPLARNDCEELREAIRERVRVAWSVPLPAADQDQYDPNATGRNACSNCWSSLPPIPSMI